MILNLILEILSHHFILRDSRFIAIWWMICRFLLV